MFGWSRSLAAGCDSTSFALVVIAVEVAPGVYTGRIGRGGKGKRFWE